MILCLFTIQNGNGRKNTKSICGQVDDLGGMTCFGWQYNFIDEVNRIGNTGIFGYGTICKINGSVLTNRYIFQQGIPPDRLIYIGLIFRTQIDCFCIATSFEIEDSLVVPSMFIITNKIPF